MTWVNIEKMENEEYKFYKIVYWVLFGTLLQLRVILFDLNWLIATAIKVNFVFLG